MFKGLEFEDFVLCIIQSESKSLWLEAVFRTLVLNHGWHTLNLPGDIWHILEVHVIIISGQKPIDTFQWIEARDRQTSITKAIHKNVNSAKVEELI